MQASHAPVVDLDLRSFAKNDTAILGSIKITLSPAETLALVGPSGIGKTSLLRIIAGIETGFEGDRRVHGKIAMVFQEPTLLPWRCLRDNITIPTGVDAKTAEDALTEVGLAGRGSDFPAQLSLGQQRRLSLARAFAVKPTLLLLDEPTGEASDAELEPRRGAVRALPASSRWSALNARLVLLLTRQRAPLRARAPRPLNTMDSDADNL